MLKSIIDKRPPVINTEPDKYPFVTPDGTVNGIAFGFPPAGISIVCATMEVACCEYTDLVIAGINKI